MNAAKRTTQTFKNHLISGFCCTDIEWPLQLWNNLTKQALITLTLCRTSRKHPDRLAYHSFYGRRNDWNKHPMAQPRKKPLYMKHQRGDSHGGQEASMVGIVDQRLIIIETCIFTFQKGRRIAHQRFTSCSHSTANCRHYQTSNTTKTWHKSE